MATDHGGTGTTKSPHRILVNLTIDDLDLRQDIPKGVYVPCDKKRARPYIAQGCYKGKKYMLGRFSDPQEAGEVYKRFREDPEVFLLNRCRTLGTS